MNDESLIVLIPVFNDWTACNKVLDNLNAALTGHDMTAGVLLLDDASTEKMPDGFCRQTFAALSQVDVLKLSRNLGHQRAICIGLAYVEANTTCRAVVVMDGDGEDDPQDVPKLVEKCLIECHGEKVVFAERARRSEGIVFRLCYFIFRLFHRLLTGHRIRFGNFSVVPRVRLTSLVTVSELWSHYAAAVVCSRQPFCCMPTTRADRAEGNSKMNFTGLVIHGLSAMSVFSEVIGVRVCAASSVLALLSVLGIGCVVAVRLLTDLATPGWATFAAGTLLVVLLQAIMFAVFFSFVILSERKAAAFVPSRDYYCFVGTVAAVYRKPCSPPIVRAPHQYRAATPVFSRR